MLLSWDNLFLLFFFFFSHVIKQEDEEPSVKKIEINPADQDVTKEIDKNGVCQYHFRMSKII